MRYQEFRLTLGAALVCVSLFGAQAAQAQSRSYCAVEIGSKGVKGRGFEFGVKGGDSSVRTNFSRDINTTIIASLKDGVLASTAMEETAEAAATLIQEMRTTTPDCKAFAVGSSGVALAKNKEALAEAVGRRIDMGALDFVTPEQEAEYGFISSVPKRDWPSTVLVDIGSSNTKIGYVSDGKFRAADIPFGSVSLSKKAAEGGADFSKALAVVMDTQVRPAFRDASARAPGMGNRKKVIWIGGAAWSTATFMRPDQSLRAFVRLDRTDVKRFMGGLNDRTWSNHKPSAKASAKVQAAFDKDAARVLDIFTRDNLLSGVGLFDVFLNDRGVEGPVHFARQGQWLMGYAAARFADEVWSDEALE